MWVASVPVERMPGCFEAATLYNPKVFTLTRVALPFTRHFHTRVLENALYGRVNEVICMESQRTTRQTADNQAGVGPSFAQQPRPNPQHPAAGTLPHSGVMVDR
jgi:hypothetical protein